MAVTMQRVRQADGAAEVRPPSGRGVRVPELVLGVLLVGGFALAGVVWHQSTTTTEQIAVLAADVVRGQVLTEADLRPAAVAGEGIAVVPWLQREALVGEVARLDLAAGTAVTPSLTQPSPLLAASEGLVALRLEPGFAPALSPGDVVDAVAVPAAGEPAADTPIVSGAVVWDASLVPGSETSTVVTLRLPLDGARRLGAVAAGVRLVRVGA